MEELNLSLQDMQLEKPIVFFDLETTGTAIQHDRIVEISVIKISPDGTHEIKTRRINPEMPIPPEASEIHGIKDEDVADAPTFRSISKNLYIYLEDCDLGGYNLLRFDVPLLIEEFKRVGLEFSAENRRIVDIYSIFCQKEPRSLSAAYKFYCDKELKDAHSAEADIIATVEIFKGQQQKYPDLPKTLDELDEFCTQRDPNWIDSTGKFIWKNEEATVNFGRNSGIPLQKIAVDNPGFLQWIIKADFPPDAKDISKRALSGEFPKKS